MFRINKNVKEFNGMLDKVGEVFAHNRIHEIGYMLTELQKKASECIYIEYYVEGEHSEDSPEYKEAVAEVAQLSILNMTIACDRDGNICGVAIPTELYEKAKLTPKLRARLEANIIERLVVNEDQKGKGLYDTTFVKCPIAFEEEKIEVAIQDKEGS